MTVTLRKIEVRDEARWRELWDKYLQFYKSELPDAVTRHTWARIMDPQSCVDAIVAEQPGNGVICMAHYLTHESTWTQTPVCYLEDLFVDPPMRAAGVGQLMIDWLVAQMKAQGWSSLYWHTSENNYRARGLYDKFSPHSGFVRYVVKNQHM